MRNTAITLLFVSLLAACGKSEPVKTELTQPALIQPQESNVIPDIVATNLVDAIEQVKPQMTDAAAGEQSSNGKILLARWAMKNMNFSEIQSLPSSSFALTMKDPDETRGRKLCIQGSVIEISVEKVPDGKIAIAGMFDASHNIYRVIAVGSSGDITSESRAKFCGVIIGREDYENSNGGVSHAVALVGMFDIPENKTSAGLKTDGVKVVAQVSDNPYATMEKFTAVKNGMKEADVYNIMGGEGEVLSESEFSGTKTSMHMWKSEGGVANMNIMFQGGKVINKAQLGLK